MLDINKLFRLGSFRRVFFGDYQYRIEEVNLIFDSLFAALTYVATELDYDVVWCITRYNDCQLIARSAYV